MEPSPTDFLHHRCSGDGGNPLEMVPYFKKENHNAYKTRNYSSFMAPKNCQEYIYRIYVLNKTDVVKAKNIWDTIKKNENENELKD